MSAARPPEGAHTVAEGEGTPVSAARPPEGAHTVAEGEGTPYRNRKRRHSNERLFQRRQRRRAQAARLPEPGHLARPARRQPVDARRPARPAGARGGAGPGRGGRGGGGGAVGVGPPAV